MKPIRLALMILAFAWLAGCADTAVPKAQPSFYRNLTQPGAELDAAAAASMISGYRANNGLPAVALDPELMRLAQAQAEVMASCDKLDHGAGKPFVQRLKARAMTPGRRPRISAPAITPWRKRFRAGGTRTRTVPTCCWRERPAWALRLCTRPPRNTRFTGR